MQRLGFDFLSSMQHNVSQLRRFDVQNRHHLELQVTVLNPLALPPKLTGPIIDIMNMFNTQFKV